MKMVILKDAGSLCHPVELRAGVCKQRLGGTLGEVDDNMIGGWL